jgi:tRNA 2-selenouridine synthase
MSGYKIDVEDALKLKNAVWFDVRSPGEYEQATVPGAFSLPIFDNEERKIIGTIYHQIGTEHAKDKGLEIVSTKLPELVRSFKQQAGDREVVVFCWRGGMRSESIVAVLRAMGLAAYQLNGGYKQYRRYVLNQISSLDVDGRFVVIHGPTGSGKTKLLYELKKINVPMIDLEGLANHRGSVFGDMFLGHQPTQKMFESKLFNLLQKYEHEKWIVLENESKKIGRIWLQDSFYSAMTSGKHIYLSVSLETRIKRILKEYYRSGETVTPEDCLERLEQIKKWIGNSKISELKQLIANKDWERMVRILLVDYYDPLYMHGDKKYAHFDLVIEGEDLPFAAQQIKRYLFS